MSSTTTTSRSISLSTLFDGLMITLFDGHGESV
jgi:hypothetical protein